MSKSYETPDDNDSSLSVTDFLIELFDRAIKRAFDNVQIAVVITPSKQADYQCNSAMSISQVRKCGYRKNASNFNL